MTKREFLIKYKIDEHKDINIDCEGDLFLGKVQMSSCFDSELLDKHIEMLQEFKSLEKGPCCSHENERFDCNE